MKFLHLADLHLGKRCLLYTSCGRCRSARENYLFVDIPGTYSLCPHSAEEAVACDFVRSGEADAVVVVCDATCLERTLVLALQVRSVTPNLIVCVNLLDEARRKRIAVDLPELQVQLGVPVVGVTARKKKTLSALLDALDTVAAAPQPLPDEMCIRDRNMIDPFHLEAYGVTTVNYNRDVEIFPVLNAMFQRIYGSSPYKSPTDMGVNMAGYCISDDDVC